MVVLRWLNIALGVINLLILISLGIGLKSWNSNQLFYAEFEAFKWEGKTTSGYISSLNESKGSRFIDVKCLVPGTEIAGYFDQIEFDDIPVDRAYWKTLNKYDDVEVYHYKGNYKYGVVFMPESFRQSKITTLSNPIIGGKIILYSLGGLLFFLPFWVIVFLKRRKAKRRTKNLEKIDDTLMCKACLHILYEGEYVRKVIRSNGSPQFKLLCSSPDHHYSDFQVVPLKQVMELDGSLNYVQEIKVGEIAVRDGLSSKWKCSPITDEHLL